MNTTLTSHFRAPGLAIRAAGLGLLTLAGASAPRLLADPILAQITVHIGVDVPPPPPRPEVVVVGNRPGPDFVWVGGFWDGSPGHYTWTAGHWDRPPHPHAVWMAPHWDKDGDGHYHQVKGEWRDAAKR